MRSKTPSRNGNLSESRFYELLPVSNRFTVWRRYYLKRVFRLVAFVMILLGAVLAGAAYSIYTSDQAISAAQNQQQQDLAQAESLSQLGEIRAEIESRKATAEQIRGQELFFSRYSSELISDLSRLPRNLQIDSIAPVSELSTCSGFSIDPSTLAGCLQITITASGTASPALLLEQLKRSSALISGIYITNLSENGTYDLIAAIAKPAETETTASTQAPSTAVTPEASPEVSPSEGADATQEPNPSQTSAAPRPGSSSEPSESASQPQTQSETTEARPTQSAQPVEGAQR